MFEHRDTILDHVRLDRSSPLRLLLRFDDEGRKSYPFMGKFQPFIAALALTGCVVILVVASGAWLWHGWKGSSSSNAFLSAYLIVSSEILSVIFIF